MLWIFLISLVLPRVFPQCPETNIPISAHCPYFNNRYLNGTETSLSSDSSCHWYSPHACCTPVESQRLVEGVADNLFVDATESCLDLLNLLVCYVCSPNQSLFYIPGQLVICGDFCDRIFSACSSAVWKGVSLRTHFNNGSHFCLSRGYTIEETNDLNSCFNSANRPGSSIWTLITCLFISLLFVSKFSLRILIGFLLFFSVFVYAESQLLTTDVNIWADSIGNFTQSVTRDLLRVDALQSTFNSAVYSELRVNGSELRDEMEEQLSEIYQEAKLAVQTLVNSTEMLFNRDCTNTDYTEYNSLEELRLAGLFYDADTSYSLPPNSSSVKISDSVARNGLIREIALTSNLTETFINVQQRSQFITRLYFGSVSGFLREFPGRKWERNIIGFPREYDPRLQNWYHAATSRPKDIVIIIDCSSSMLENDRWQLALSTIEILLQTLTQEDFINIICSASSAYLDQESSTPEYIDARVMSECSKDSLMPATSGVKRHLMNTMRKEPPLGGSDHRDGFTLAFKLLWGQVDIPSRECEPIILFLTDGEDSDPVFCRPASYFGTEEGALFVPGPNCVYDFNEVYEHINRLETDYTNYSSRDEIKIIGFAITNTATTLPYNISCSHGGFGVSITNGIALYSQLSQYFDYINQNSTEIELLNPYGGEDGQLILTAVSPVYKQCGSENTLVGVIGVDYSLSAVQVVLSKARTDGSYAFIINQFGEALFHPRIDPIARLIPNPIYPPLSSLENCPNTSNISICANNSNPTNIESLIISSTVRTGEFTVLRIPRLALRGDHQDGVEWTLGNSNYYYTPISDTKYILGLNLDDSFLNQFVLTSLPSNMTYTEPYYNIFSEYPQDTLDTFGLEPPKFCVSSPFNVSTNQSLVTLAPISVCDPNNFKLNHIPGPLTVYEYFSNFLNKSATDSFEGCVAKNEIFRDRLLSSILLTSPLGVKWHEVASSGVVWRYIGLENGVLRILPGVEIGTGFNPTVRPWYRRAVAEKNRLAISYVYLDVGGAGKTVTLSRAVYKSPPILNLTNCSYPGCNCTMDTECDTKLCIPELKVCSTERIAGVTGFDYTYTEFSSTIHKHLRSLSDRNNTFYIFDSQTFIILADEILNAYSYNTAEYERVSLGYFQPEIVRDMVDRKRLLIEEVSFDFHSSCSYSNSFSLAREVNLSLLDKTGIFPPYQNEYSCLQTVRNFYINETLLGSLNGPLVGSISPNNNCRYGDYYVSAVSGTNAFLLVLDNWVTTKECRLDPTAQSGPILDLTGGTHCAGLFSEIQLTANYNCSTPIYTPQCQSVSGAHALASSILIGLFSLLLVYSV